MQEGESEDDTYLQSLVQFRRNKLNINSAEQNELRELKLLTDLQIINLIRYRQLLGNLVSIYELQAVPAWDVETILRILPFITVGTVVPFGIDIGERFANGNHSLLMRMQQVLERSEGFKRPDTVLNRYPGSPQRLFFRYKYTYRNLLQYGIVGDKDAGEQFFNGSQRYGFDFYSFHLFARKLGPVRLLALGDFTVNMGQGLIHWQSLAFRKSAEVMAVKRQADILRPYNSAGEFNFHRGVGVTVGSNKLNVTAFGSVKEMDGTLNSDTSTTNEDFISSILNNGLHRTPNEVGKRNSFTQTTVGGNISYNSTGFHLGVNGVGYRFSTPLQRNLQPYNQFAITGKDWLNYSVDYSYTYRNMHLFGEAAMDKNNSKALLAGMMVNLDQRVDASLVYRNIEKSYQAVYGNAFTESTYPNNEKGLYAGLSVKPYYWLRVDAYADVFSFPWLRYRVDAPSTGSEYMFQVTYRPNKQVEVYTRYRNENKAINLSGLNLPTRETVTRPRQNWRTQIAYKPSRDVTLRNRVELMWFDQQVEERRQQGFLTYFDVAYRPFGKPVSITTRLQYFETEGYDSRIYAFENDVLYSFSIPQFIGKGMRYYVNLNYDVSKKLTMWFRWAQTIYSNQNTIGSGLDRIDGNRRSEVKIQAMYNF
nr:helix-hairpin-helix domain-containing protein [Aridibaculum aurantiacum]